MTSKTNQIGDNRFFSLSESICYWLGYQFKIGREQLIHEASLRYPIADTLTSKKLQIDQIELETLHPIFKSRKIDLTVYADASKRREKDSSAITEAYEFKLVSRNTGEFQSSEHQRVFNDIARLAFLNFHNKIDCYFLMCGRFEDFNSYFVTQSDVPSSIDGKNTIKTKSKEVGNNNNQWVPKGFYSDWFGFTIGSEKEKTFNNDEEWGLKKFQKDYDTRNNLGITYLDEIKVKTTCMAISRYDGLTRTHAAGIWKVDGITI